MVDILTLIFQTILKISPSLISQYHTLPDQVLYLLLIPHIILFLFIYFLAIGIVGKIVPLHKGIMYLIGFAIYAYIILSGLYGTMLVPLFMSWFIIAVFIGLGLFLIAVVIHPARIPSLIGLFGTVGKAAVKKGKDREALEKRLDVVNDQITRINQQLGADPTNHILQYRLSQLEEEKKTIEKELA